MANTTKERREELRQALHKFKPKGLDDVDENLSNLKSILDEYEIIHKIAKDLVDIRGMSFKEAQGNHAVEYMAFKTCYARINRIHGYVQFAVQHERGKEYAKIRHDNPRADMSDRAIQQVIDGVPNVHRLTSKLLRTKEVLDLFQGIIDSYHQRGYSLNNVTRSIEKIDAEGYII